MTITRVAITDVRPDPKQPRTHFDQRALAALATSIKKNGQRSPITVRPRRAGAKPPYEIIDGERRWRACQLAGVDTIRIDVEERDFARHADQHRLSVVANFLREGHTVMETSHALQYQVDAAVEAGQTRGQAAQGLMEDLGKSEGWVYQYLSLQRLDPDLQDRLHPDTPDDKRLRFSEAIVLASLEPPRQRAIYRQLLRVPAAQRLQRARKLAEEATGVPRTGRRHDIKRAVTRFFDRLSGEVDRLLEYKQSDFRKACAAVPASELKGLRADVAFLLAELDKALGAARK